MKGPTTSGLAILQMAADRPIGHCDVMTLVGCKRNVAGAMLARLFVAGWLQASAAEPRTWTATDAGRQQANGVPVPVTIRAKPNTRPSSEVQAVITPRTKMTRAPGWTHDTRYQLSPDTQIVGGFATMGIGRYVR